MKTFSTLALVLLTITSAHAEGSASGGSGLATGRRQIADSPSIVVTGVRKPKVFGNTSNGSELQGRISPQKAAAPCEHPSCGGEILNK